MRGLLRALVVAACTFAIAYSLLRVAQALFFPAPDPRTVVVVGRIAFYWRCAIAGFAAIVAGIGGSALAARSPRSFDEQLSLLLTTTIAIGVLQGVFVP